MIVRKLGKQKALAVLTITAQILSLVPGALWTPEAQAKSNELTDASGIDANALDSSSSCEDICEAIQPDSEWGMSNDQWCANHGSPTEQGVVAQPLATASGTPSGNPFQPPRPNGRGVDAAVPTAEGCRYPVRPEDIKATGSEDTACKYVSQRLIHCKFHGTQLASQCMAKGYTKKSDKWQKILMALDATAAGTCAIACVAEKTGTSLATGLGQVIAQGCKYASFIAGGTEIIAAIFMDQGPLGRAAGGIGGALGIMNMATGFKGHGPSSFEFAKVNPVHSYFLESTLRFIEISTQLFVSAAHAAPYDGQARGQVDRQACAALGINDFDLTRSRCLVTENSRGVIVARRAPVPVNITPAPSRAGAPQPTISAPGYRAPTTPQFARPSMTETADMSYCRSRNGGNGYGATYEACLSQRRISAADGPALGGATLNQGTRPSVTDLAGAAAGVAGAVRGPAGATPPVSGRQTGGAVVSPPATTPRPATAPPATARPTTAPPATTPVATAPPATTPVTTAPPATTPVTTAPPATTPVATAPPATTPVATAPPATTPVATAPPATTPVATAPPATTPVATAPPATTPVATAPPATTPVATAPPATTPVATAPPPAVAETPLPACREGDVACQAIRQKLDGAQDGETRRALCGQLNRLQPSTSVDSCMKSGDQAADDATESDKRGKHACRGAIIFGALAGIRAYSMSQSKKTSNKACEEVKKLFSSALVADPNGFQDFNYTNGAPSGSGSNNSSASGNSGRGSGGSGANSGGTGGRSGRPTANQSFPDGFAEVPQEAMAAVDGQMLSRSGLDKILAAKAAEVDTDAMIAAAEAGDLAGYLSPGMGGSEVGNAIASLSDVAFANPPNMMIDSPQSTGTMYAQGGGSAPAAKPAAEAGGLFGGLGGLFGGGKNAAQPDRQIAFDQNPETDIWHTHTDQNIFQIVSGRIGKSTMRWDPRSSGL